MRRRSLFPYASVLATLSLVTASAVVLSAPASAAPVVISAVDFADGTTGSWTASGGGPSTLSVVDLEGGKVLRVADRDADYVGIQSPTGIFQPGTTYSFSMRVRLADGTPDSSARLVMKPTYTWIGDTAVTAAAWTTIAGQYIVPSDADPAALQVYIGTSDQSPAAPYTYYVDDIVVTAEDSAGGGPDPDVPPGGAMNPTTTPVSAAQGTGNVAALTFDDGPNPGTTPALLDFLAENDIQATFCVIGQNITAPGGAEILRRIVAEGHTLCNHTTSYADMGGFTATQVRADLVENLRIIREALGDPDAPVPFFRAPNGSWGVTPQVAVDLGMQPLAVTNTINDWATQDEATLTTNLRAAVKPGEIVLAHDGGGDRTGTLAAVRTVVTERLAAGWSFTLPVGALVTAPEPTALSTGFESGLDGWGPRDSGSGAPSVAVSGVLAHDGAQSALVSARTSQGSGIGHVATGILVAGQTYRATAWLRFAAGQTPGDIWLSLANTAAGATTYSTLGQFSGMSNSQWVQVSATFTMPATSDSSYLYFETSYNATNTSDFFIDDISVSIPAPSEIEDLLPIKDTVEFPVGVAIDSRETQGSPSELLLRHFDQVTPENYMKPEAWYDADNTFRASPEAIALMDYARDNDLRVYGHVLVWHSQTPEWFFQGADGQPLGTSEADRQILRDRMREHIFSIAQWMATEYGAFGAGNPLTAFDVVNEVISDSGEFDDGLRRSEWYRILGEEFIDLAFEYADEAFNGLYAAAGSDRPVTLFINDYNTEQDGKQNRYAALVDRLLERGIPLDGVGHQFHVSLALPVSALAAALARFEDLPVVQAITELDVTTGTPVTQAKLVDQGYYYRDAFRAFRQYSDDIYSVTVWGLTDSRSWRADNGAPLVFDDSYLAKPAYYGIVDGDLPAPSRTANVFQGDVQLNADAAASPEWDRLPLVPIEQTGAFQLRWEPDHLTVFVAVEDAAPGGADAVTFRVDEAEFTVPRSADGDVEAVVTEREGGYDIVAHLPLDAAALGATVAFDVRLTHGATTVGWNADDALGTLTLIEPLSFVEVMRAPEAPQIDGSADAAWADADAVTTGKQIEGSGGAVATIRTLWRENTLYVLAEVADPVVDVSGSDPWIQDSVEIFVDAGNYKNGSYRYDDSQIRISAANVLSFGTGDEAFQRGRVQSATRAVEGGYVVEAAISLLEEGGAGTFHGLDFQVNDGTAGARTGCPLLGGPDRDGLSVDGSLGRRRARGRRRRGTGRKPRRDPGGNPGPNPAPNPGSGQGQTGDGTGSNGVRGGGSGRDRSRARTRNRPAGRRGRRSGLAAVHDAPTSYVVVAGGEAALGVEPGRRLAPQSSPATTKLVAPVQ